jgi:uncharacterized protein DUF4382
MRAGRGLVVGVVALLGLAACEGTGPAVGTVHLHLTDAPAPDIASATVWISRAELIPGGAGGVVVTDVPQVFDLLSLQGGVTALLGTATIPVGDYSQLRLIVDSARITLGGGATFADGSSEAVLIVPSGMQTGIKVNLSGPVHVAPGETNVVIDFDVARSFVFQGGSPPSGASFKPVIHASAMDVTGSISGTSLPVEARGKLLAIMGTDTVARSLADTLTGSYTLHFLPPGTYTVADSAVGFQVATQVVVVGPAQQVTGVNFTLVP